jgi:hypothetical protein
MTVHAALLVQRMQALAKGKPHIVTVSVVQNGRKKLRKKRGVLVVCDDLKRGLRLRSLTFPPLIDPSLLPAHAYRVISTSNPPGRSTSSSRRARCPPSTLTTRPCLPLTLGLPAWNNL